MFFIMNLCKFYFDCICFVLDKDKVFFSRYFLFFVMLFKYNIIFWELKDFIVGFWFSI